MAGKEPRRNEFLSALRTRVAGPRGMKRFSSLVGIPYTTYRNYEMGRNRVPFLAATAIAAATGEDPYSIMAGKVTAEKAPAKPPSPPKEYVLKARGHVNLDGFRKKSGLKKRIPVQVTAEDFGKGDDFIKKGNRFAFYARGDSMAPLIRDGDVLTIACPARLQPRIGHVVAFVHPSSKTLAVHRVVRVRKGARLLQGDASP